MEKVEKSPIEEFISLYTQFKDQFEKLPPILSRLLEQSEDIMKKNADLKEKLKTLEEKFGKLQNEYSSKDGKIKSLEDEVTKYKSKLESVEEQMSGLREMYEEMTQERAKDLEIQELLAIYTILFEQVFAANPHTKILLLLQAVDKEVWTRDEFVKTTGFSPATIIKALHDLRNSGIIELDESAQQVKLIQKKSLVKEEEKEKVAK